MLQEDTECTDTTSAKNIFITSLVAGASAGTVCDLIFFPLDTLKTRLQSQHGFMQSGGFKRVYQGLGPVMIGSAPAASVFFITYNGIKQNLQPYLPQQYHTFVHMTAAISSEVVKIFFAFALHQITSKINVKLYLQIK